MASKLEQITAKRYFVIGDLHGCPDEPAVMLNYLVNQEGLSQDDAVIFLGDYIDRGPNSKAVIDLMIDFKKRYPATRFLKGNHEDMMLDFFGFGGRLGQAFLHNGGLETIQSYGISVFDNAEEMAAKLPEEHRNFLYNLDSIITFPGYITVHAGLNPFREINLQNDGDVFWIRDEFIANIHNFKALVVFGHTPHREVLLHQPYKIGIDTGLVFGNKLSCLELPSGKLYQIKNSSSQVTISTIKV
ncbi:serine/threonine protein phosphatase [bacterium]|nr:serine/threonine protein phosphatase [bacterium]